MTMKKTILMIKTMMFYSETTMSKEAPIDELLMETQNKNKISSLRVINKDKSKEIITLIKGLYMEFKMKTTSLLLRSHHSYVYLTWITSLMSIRSWLMAGIFMLTISKSYVLLTL
jgi:hypothetical protein